MHNRTTKLKIMTGLASLATSLVIPFGVTSAQAEAPAPAPVASSVQAAPGEHTLPVDYQEQETGYWCGPAAVRNALSTIMENPPSQQELANYMGTTEAGTDHISAPAQAMTDFGPSGTWYVEEMPNDPPTQEQKDLLWQRIVTDIDDGYPLILNIVAPPGNQPPGYPSDQTIYHYVAVTGYNGDTGEVQITDSAGFTGTPPQYWLSFEQVASLVPPKGYAW